MRTKLRTEISGVALSCAMLLGCHQAQKLQPASTKTPFPEMSSNLVSADGQFRATADEPAGPVAAAVGKVRSALTPTPPASEPETGGRALPQVSPRESQFAEARLLERRGDLLAAEECYREYLRQFPNDPAANHRLGILAARAGRFQESEAHMLVALQHNPNSVQLMSDLGYLYYLQGRLEEGERILRQGLALEPYHEAANNNLGLVLGDEGRVAESLAAFRRVGDEARAHANLAYVFAQHGDLERAKEGYQYSLQQDNKLRPAASALLQIVERQEKDRQALAAQIPGASEPGLARAKWYTQPNYVPSADSPLETSPRQFPVGYAVCISPTENREGAPSTPPAVSSTPRYPVTAASYLTEDASSETSTPQRLPPTITGHSFDEATQGRF